MLKYRVSAQDLEGHYLDVSLSFKHAGSAHEPARPLIVSLPAWIPGSYMIREFARHVLSVSAQVDGQAVPVRKQSKDEWVIECPSSPVGTDGVQIDLQWRVYCWDLSVRGAHVDRQHAFFNGTSLFLCPEGYHTSPIELTLAAPGLPAGQAWLVATGLDALGQTRDESGCYGLTATDTLVLRCANYDALIDHPVEMGVLKTAHFSARGAQHTVAVYGADADVDLARLCDDLQPVCEAQIDLFEPQLQKAPFEHYVFMVHATDNGYGGLEHRNSTALLCSRHDLPQRGVAKAPKGYETFLGLCSHEYFHAWNVKRMKPQVFLPYDLSQENYTRLLWIFEGFTSYYDDVMLARSGVMGEKEYLAALGKTITAVLKNRGRLIQSVADSSFDAWTKYYRQDENAPNAVVSYYTKGALVALCLDTRIRQATQGQHSLDDVMRLMWQRKGSEQEGLREDEFPALVYEATGLDLSEEIADWAYGTVDLPLAETLAAYGLDMKAVRDDSADLGMNVQFKADGVWIKQVINGGPAHNAGLSAGDQLVLVGERKATEANFKRALGGLQAGEPLTLGGFRAERWLSTVINAAAPATKEWTISQQPEAIQPVIQPPWVPNSGNN